MSHVNSVQTAMPGVGDDWVPAAVACGPCPGDKAADVAAGSDNTIIAEQADGRSRGRAR